jgi:hypothetical protein
MHASIQHLRPNRSDRIPVTSELPQLRPCINEAGKVLCLSGHCSTNGLKRVVSKTSSLLCSSTYDALILYRTTPHDYHVTLGYREGCTPAPEGIVSMHKKTKQKEERNGTT